MHRHYFGRESASCVGAKEAEKALFPPKWAGKLYMAKTEISTVIV